MNRKKLIWQLPLLTLLVVGTVIIISQQRSMPYQKISGFVFGTVYNITYQGEEDLRQEIEAELRKVDADFSMFNKQSIVSKINRGEKAELSDSFLEVYDLARQVSDNTGGAFDVTVAPLVNAWGFGYKARQMPDTAKVDSLRRYVGMDKIRLTKAKRIEKKYPEVSLDFSAIAKGYGCDRVARMLKARGINNYMVEIGGEIVARGINEKRLPWRIGVTKPTEDSLGTAQELQTVINVTDIAMATSGNYRNFYYKGGKKYAHTIDPKTGYPVQHNILSATVLSKSCAQADAYATAFMVLGMEGTMKVLKEHPELMVYLIYSDLQGKNAVWYSPKLKEKIVNP